MRLRRKFQLASEKRHSTLVQMETDEDQHFNDKWLIACYCIYDLDKFN